MTTNLHVSTEKPESEDVESYEKLHWIEVGQVMTQQQHEQALRELGKDWWTDKR